jgi:hypothetical protein
MSPLSLDQNFSVSRGNTSSQLDLTLLISSYQPNPNAAGLLRTALKSAIFFGGEKVAIWVVDASSPETSFRVRPSEFPTVTFIETDFIPRAWEPKGLMSRLGRDLRLPAPYRGSTANGWGLDFGFDQILKQEKIPRFLMTLQMDIMFTHAEVFDYLLGKFSSATAAVGVRPQASYRGKETILHSLGCVWDVEKLRSLGTSFLPDFPEFDTGEKVVAEALKNGFEIHGLHNSFIDPGLVITETKYRDLHVDRTINDDGEVVFLHLGRGLPKSVQEVQVGDSLHKWWALAASLDL